ncbi:MAG TPA: FapA family protein, partial [Syntrophorhabdaceae bacterium]|nr:FapA family protein [Syntrophorhabdaceae bacterium]
VTMNTLGSPIAGRTQVSVGFEPKTLALLKELKEEAEKTERTIEEIRKHISTLEEMSLAGRLPDEKERLYGRLLATADELEHQLQEQRGRVEMIESTMTKAAQPTVRVRGACYPNARIKIGTQVFDCTTEYHSAVFYEEEGRIKVNVYDNKT